MLRLRDVDTSYGRIRVLRGVDFALHEGEVVGLVGKSGAGKSTLLHVLGTLDDPTSGTVLYKGEDLFARSELHLADFRRAFNRLSEPHREVLVLVGIEGMDYQRAASILGVEIGTVKSRVFRARECLRREQLMLERPTPRASWHAAA